MLLISVGKLSAEQLLDAEIEKASSELAETLGEDGSAMAASLDEHDATDHGNPGSIAGFEDDTSSVMELANLAELDMTSELDAQNDASSGDLDVTARIEVEDKTVEMPRNKDGTRAR